MFGLFRSRRQWGALAVLGCLLAGCQPGAQGTSHPGVGKALSQLELQGLTGDAKDVSLTDLSDKVALVNFWGTWCPPCVEEVPHIAALEKKHKDSKDFKLLAVSSAPDPAADVDELRDET